jgi:type VI protein secretion system component VasF
MSPEFAAVVDPLLLEIIGLSTRVREGRAGAPAEEQGAISAAFKAAESRVPASRKRDWDLARYALVSLVDETLIVDLAWQGQAWWEEHCLEYALYSFRNRAEAFYLQADEACGLDRRDAVEVFITAVLLGFRGKFRERPAELESWLRVKEQLVRVGQDRPAVTDAAGDVVGARAQYGCTGLVWSSLVAALAAAMLVVASYVARG